MAKKKSKTKGVTTSREAAQKRKHKATFLLNDKENDAINAYCKKYKIANKAKFMRETILRTVVGTLLEDYPTLFEKSDMDKLKV